MAWNNDSMEKIRDLLSPLGFYLWKSNEGSIVVSSNGRWLLCDIKNQSKLYDLATPHIYDKAFVDDDLTVTAEQAHIVWQAKTSVAGDRIQTQITTTMYFRMERNATTFVRKNGVVQFALLEHIALLVEKHSDIQLGIPIEREYTMTYEQLELTEMVRIMARSWKIACFFESGEKWVAIVVLCFPAVSIDKDETHQTLCIGFDGQQIRNMQLPGILNKCSNSMYSGLDDNHFCFWTKRKGGAYMAMRIDFGEEISIIPVAAFATPRPQTPLAASGFSIYYRGDDERLWVWRLRRPQSLLLTAHFAALHSGTRSTLPAIPPIAPLIGADRYDIHYTNRD